MDQSTLLRLLHDQTGHGTESMPGWQANQIKVGEVMFVMTHTVDDRPAVSLKISAEMAEALRSVFNAASLGARLNKAN